MGVGAVASAANPIGVGGGGRSAKETYWGGGYGLRIIIN